MPSEKDKTDHENQMKPASAPDVPGNTDGERFDDAVRKFFTVSKEDFLKEEGRLKKLPASKVSLG